MFTAAPDYMFLGLTTSFWQALLSPGVPTVHGVAASLSCSLLVLWGLDALLLWCLGSSLPSPFYLALSVLDSRPSACGIFVVLGDLPVLFDCSFLSELHLLHVCRAVHSSHEPTLVCAVVLHPPFCMYLFGPCVIAH